MSNILVRQVLRNKLKRKTQENLEHPSKLICQQLLVNGDRDITDIVNIKYFINNNSNEIL